MSKNLSVAQFIYKYPTENDISPKGYSPEQDICSLLKGTIKTLGIQAPQGAEVYINDQRVIIGSTGVFELDNVIEITSLKLINTNYLRKVIIDILYEKESD